MTPMWGYLYVFGSGIYKYTSRFYVYIYLSEWRRGENSAGTGQDRTGQDGAGQGQAEGQGTTQDMDRHRTGTGTPQGTETGTGTGQGTGQRTGQDRTGQYSIRMLQYHNIIIS